MGAEKPQRRSVSINRSLLTEFGNASAFSAFSKSDCMAWHRTSRHITDHPDPVNAACGAAGDLAFDSAAQVSTEIGQARDVVGGFGIFKCPLLFGSVDLAEVVDASV